MLIFRAWATCDASDVMNFFFAVSPQASSTLIFGCLVAPCVSYQYLGVPIYIYVCQDNW